MRNLMTTAALAAALATSACGGKGDDKLGDQARQAMDNKADAMDAAADNMRGPAADAMEARADATRDAGEAKEERVDDSDVDTTKLTPEERNAVVAPN